MGSKFQAGSITVGWHPQEQFSQTTMEVWAGPKQTWRWGGLRAFCVVPTPEGSTSLLKSLPPQGLQPQSRAGFGDRARVEWDAFSSKCT